VLDVTISLNGGPRSVPAGSSVTSLVERTGTGSGADCDRIRAQYPAPGSVVHYNLDRGKQAEIVHFVRWRLVWWREKRNNGIYGIDGRHRRYEGHLGLRVSRDAIASPKESVWRN
jgi:hypothetical protein